MTTFDADDIMASAIELAGSDDFGPSDFRVGLEVLCDAAGSEAKLNDLGDMAMRQNMIGGLANRLRVTDWVRRHPEVVAEPVEAPMVVIGLFRAGTTFVSELFDRDPANRSLLRWEAGDSVPPPTVETLRSGPRIDAAAAGIDMLESLNPKIKVVHHEDAAGPTECLTLLGQDFKSLTWEAIANVPSYSDWLLSVDQRSAYEYHRTVLQVLQSSGARGRWTLKSPHHAIALDALTAVYPDAQLVVLHRDPTVLCASACSLLSTLTGTFSDADHTSYIAEHWTRMLEVSIERIERYRRANPGRHIVDVHYADLTADPVGTVELIYQACGRVLSPRSRDAIRDYVGSHPRGRFGAHGYRLEDYGLHQERIRERFADYVDRYDVHVELSR
ncbi:MULTISPECIES: sulfotransferase [unclassified Mycobacterium]|uniref:sulfotransferase family protein n=1 Tax=unclassified Mycobacterium TaxID=2642494 RepID=UPI000B131FCB|nr:MULTISPECIES: sulfotransferase [unclassified Mycobacterium]